MRKVAFVVAAAAALLAPVSATAAEDGAPRFAGIRATFVQEDFSTYYRVSARDPEGKRVAIAWRLIPPPAEPGCTQLRRERTTFARGATKRTAIWAHGDQHGCDHTKMGPQGHAGRVRVSVSDGSWTCVAVYDGSNSGRSPAPSCTR